MEQRQVSYLSSPAVWQRGHGRSHPLKPERLERTHVLLAEYGAFDLPNVTLVAPEPAAEDELALFHTPEYIAAIQALSRGERDIPAARYNFGPGDNPVFSGMYDSEGLKVGSALQAARMLVARECDVAFSVSGGLHHGGPDFASGFCVFNDPAVAIHWLLGQGLRVAYVDIDVHHGDGVQNAFHDTDQVLTISLHQDPRTLFPGTGFIHETGSGRGEGYSVNIPLPPYTDDELYLAAFHSLVPPLLKRFAADVVVTELGVDTHFRDPLAQLSLTTAGQEALFRELAGLAPRWLAVGGGGYAVDVVPRAWVLAMGVMAGHGFPAELPQKYRERYGGRWLRDQEAIGLEEQARSKVAAAAETVVAEVRRAHGL